jgi:hypothetical protein
MATYRTRQAVINLLESRRGLKPMKFFAREIGITPQLLTMVVAGERTPGTRILRYLGLEKVTLYQEKSHGQN